MRKIIVVTGARSEYGLVFWLLKELEADPEIDLKIWVTGMHLEPEFGSTYKVIERDGFKISEKIKMLSDDDSPSGIAKSVGVAVGAFAELLERERPDWLLLAADRYETFAAAQAALFTQTPVAHIFGGDTSEGAFDEAMRHSISKMAHLHFVTTEEARRRVVQLGEDPKQVLNYGSPSLDHLRRTKLLSRAELETALSFRFRAKNILLTYHPETLESERTLKNFQNVLDAMEKLGRDVGILITKPNADTHGRDLIEMIDAFAKGRENVQVHTSLGQQRYLSALAQVDAVVGNSSSGLYEAPSFRIPTVNIGDRQKGRLKPESVIDCAPVADAVLKAVQKAFAMDCSNVVNPYGDGNSSAKIVAALKAEREPKSLLKKHFHFLEA